MSGSRKLRRRRSTGLLAISCLSAPKALLQLLDNLNCTFFSRSKRKGVVIVEALGIKHVTIPRNLRTSSVHFGCGTSKMAFTFDVDFCTLLCWMTWAKNSICSVENLDLEAFRCKSYYWSWAKQGFKLALHLAMSIHKLHLLLRIQHVWFVEDMYNISMIEKLN